MGEGDGGLRATVRGWGKIDGHWEGKEDCDEMKGVMGKNAMRRKAICVVLCCVFAWLCV